MPETTPHPQGKKEEVGYMYQERVKIDWWTVIIWGVLVLFGWMNIYASTYSDGVAFFDFHTYHTKQLIWISIAVFMAAMLLLMEPRIFSNGAFPFYGVVMLLLVATLFLAVTVKGGTSWIDIKGFRFQPAEFGKLATALALSKYMSAIDIDWKQLRTKIIALIIVALPAALVFLQHDTGSALVFLAFIFPLFREGLSGAIFIIGVVVILLFVLALLVNKYILIGALVVIALLYLFVWRSKRSARDYWQTLGVLILCAGFIFSVDIVFNSVLEQHQRGRIEDLLGITDDPQGTGYNVHQSKIAIGSGGLTGKGFLQGTITKADFVPEQHTDFIFCTVGEEWGWIGSIAVIGLYVFLLVRLINMAERQRSTFARFYGYCVASILFVHFAVNIGMVIGLMPVIGIPLPFFSYGGSSLIAFTVLLFIFIRLDATKNQLY